MTVTAVQAAFGSQVAADATYKRAKTAVDELARLGMERLCQSLPVTGSSLFYYAQLREAEQAAYEAAQTAQAVLRDAQIRGAA